MDLSKTESNPVRCPDEATADKMIAKIKSIRKAGDTIGGTVSCVIKNVPIGLGEPVFNKLHAELGSAMLSINAVKGFEYGSGFAGTQMTGSQHNDTFNEDGTTDCNLDLVEVNNEVSLEGFQFNILQNPTEDGVLAATFQQEQANTIYFQLFDLNGRLIQNEEFTSTLNTFNHQLNVSNLPRGMYIFRVSDNQKVKTHKVLLI